MSFDSPHIPRLIHLDETVSTNQYLQQLTEVEDVANGSVVWTDFQTAGRGQMGNSWESEEGLNLTCSILYLPSNLRANQPFLISELMALSIKYMLDHYTTDITIKWPNDIYWKDKKICGILIENKLSGSLISQSIMGMGINLNQKLFRTNPPNPVSLTQITGENYDRLDILYQVWSHFYNLHNLFEKEGIDSIHIKYLTALYRKTGYFPFEDLTGKFEACIRAIEPSGHLVLERKDGTLSRYAFKEVSYL